jgi:hypothetical protein
MHEAEEAFGMNTNDLKSATDDAIERSEAHADPDWKEAAFDAVRRCAQALPVLIVDDVWKHMTGNVDTHDNRALGPVMLRAKREGLIESTGTFRHSYLRNHGTPRPLWKSLIFSSGQTVST